MVREKRTTGPRKKGENYVDKKQFYAEIVAYYNQPEPKQITNSIGATFIKIATKLGQRKNFRYYSFIDEMIDEAVENQLYALKFFDPAKSDNPFGYFTTVSLYAFLRRIQLEAKHQYIKHKNFQRVYEENGNIGDGPSERSMEVVQKYEEKMEAIKERKRTGQKSNFRLW